eukprot:8464754-Pyramimonas_sp.AAC.2
MMCQAYGDFYKALASSSHVSWLDYLLDRIMVAPDNPLAVAMEKGECAEGIKHAAAMDLDTLQRLALAESTLATWVKSTVHTRVKVYALSPRVIGPHAGRGICPLLSPNLSAPAAHMRPPLARLVRAAGICLYPHPIGPRRRRRAQTASWTRTGSPRPPPSVRSPQAPPPPSAHPAPPVRRN